MREQTISSSMRRHSLRGVLIPLKARSSELFRARRSGATGSSASGSRSEFSSRDDVAFVGN
ncbi:MAG TPA: hypothetical protein VGF36_01885, partial [Rhodopila sp.]